MNSNPYDEHVSSVEEALPDLPDNPTAGEQQFRDTPKWHKDQGQWSNPTTGEWTGMTVANISAGCVHITPILRERIADAHNAALAAEQDKRADWNVVIEDLQQDIVQLCEQLAAERDAGFEECRSLWKRNVADLEAKFQGQLTAEREKVAIAANESLHAWETERQQLRDQLAAAQAALGRATDATGISFDAGTDALDAYVRKVVDDKVAIVRQQSAAATKPLVDALELLSAGAVAKIDRKVAKAALTKVKEGK